MRHYKVSWGRTWRVMLIILAFGRLRQEDCHELGVLLSYEVSFRAS